MATHDTIVIGTSASGVQALTQLIGNLPADLPAAVFVVLQTTNDELTARTIGLHHLTMENSEEQLHLSGLLERFPNYVMVVDVEDLTIQAVNPGYAMVLGKRDVIGQRLNELCTKSPGTPLFMSAVLSLRISVYSALSISVQMF